MSLSCKRAVTGLRLTSIVSVAGQTGGYLAMDRWQNAAGLHGHGGGGREMPRHREVELLFGQLPLRRASLHFPSFHSNLLKTDGSYTLRSQILRLLAARCALCKKVIFRSIAKERF